MYFGSVVNGAGWMSSFFMKFGPIIGSYSSFDSGSDPVTSAIDSSVVAASSTVFTIGPAVSWDRSIGAIP